MVVQGTLSIPQYSCFARDQVSECIGPKRGPEERVRALARGLNFWHGRQDTLSFAYVVAARQLRQPRKDTPCVPSINRDASTSRVQGRRAGAAVCGASWSAFGHIAQLYFTSRQHGAIIITI